MGPTVPDAGGGIASLQRFVEEHAEAVQFDLIRHGLRVRDIGETLSWGELKSFLAQLPPTGESALFRAQNPRSWWWTADHDFAAASLFAAEVSNWQRAGGKGPKPVLIKRPKEGPASTWTKTELAQHKQGFNAELERRRRRKAGG